MEASAITGGLCFRRGRAKRGKGEKAKGEGRGWTEAGIKGDGVGERAKMGGAAEKNAQEGLNRGDGCTWI